MIRAKKHKTDYLLILVSYTLFMIFLGTNIPAPLYALCRSQWDLSSGMVTLMFALYALVIVPTSIFSGQLSDRIGRKSFLMWGVGMSIMGSVSFALANGTGGYSTFAYIPRSICWSLMCCSFSNLD